MKIYTIDFREGFLLLATNLGNNGRTIDEPRHCWDRVRKPS
jgi:hypothetical protein